MTSAAGDTAAENAQSNQQEDDEIETKKNDSQEKSVQVVESKMSHPSIFDADTEDSDRDVWRWGCLFTITTLAGSLWLKATLRIPQLLLRHSGGAFMLAFTCTVLFLCIPLACIETFAGQYGGKPFLLVMGEVLPIGRGVGFAIVVDHFLELILYGVHLSQMFTYCFFALKSPVPWEKCDAKYNTKLCTSDQLEEKCIKNKAKSGYLQCTCVASQRVCQAMKMQVVNESYCSLPTSNTHIFFALVRQANCSGRILRRRNTKSWKSDTKNYEPPWRIKYKDSSRVGSRLAYGYAGRIRRIDTTTVYCHIYSCASYGRLYGVHVLRVSFGRVGRWNIPAASDERRRYDQ